MRVQKVVLPKLLPTGPLVPKLSGRVKFSARHNALVQGTGQHSSLTAWVTGVVVVSPVHE